MGCHWAAHAKIPDCGTKILRMQTAHAHITAAAEASSSSIPCSLARGPAPAFPSIDVHGYAQL